MPRFHDPSLVLPAQKRLSVLFAAAGIFLIGISVRQFVELPVGNPKLLTDMELPIRGLIIFLFQTLPGVYLLVASKGVRCGREWAKDGALAAYIVAAIFVQIDMIVAGSLYLPGFYHDGYAFVFILALTVLIILGYIDLELAERHRKRRTER